ncbi:MAG: helix-turn-helix domain-containing protein [Pseudomonadota bacterium]
MSHVLTHVCWVSDLTHIFAERLEALIKQRGITRADVTKDAKLGKSTLYDFKNRNNSIRLDTVEKVADALGVSPGFMLGFTNATDPATEIRRKFFDTAGDLLFSIYTALLVEKLVEVVEPQSLVEAYLDSLAYLLNKEDHEAAVPDAVEMAITRLRGRHHSGHKVHDVCSTRLKTSLSSPLY